MLKAFGRKLILRAWAVFAIFAISSPLISFGQFSSGLLGNRVGGVAIDAAGVVTPPERSARIPQRDALRKLHPAPAAELNAASELRMISLKGLEAACQAAAGSKELPDELRFLAGIQRIQYVLVYPEEHDIVLAGPGEGWKVDDEANVVGVHTGRPVLLLEDLLVAFRTVDVARQGGISCSIDPTAEGRQRLEALSSKRSGSGAPPLATMRKALGPQQITVTGVPADSHLARILVSSDFHLKRIGMGLEPSQVKGLPGFIDMLKRDAAGLDHPTPRWWLACDYQPLGRSDDGLAFELRGRGVKCLAEDEIVDQQGKVASTAAASSTAERWARLFTEHYDELAKQEPAFADLRNVMDLCVVAALVAKEQLLVKADCQLPELFGRGQLAVGSYAVPKTMESLCTSVNRGSSIIVMSGGVQIASWQMADRLEPSVTPSQTRARAKPANTTAAWWNPGR
jgi:hypothetical protein